MKQTQVATFKGGFVLECGAILESLEICYTTIGTLNSERNNTIWICHAFTANSDPQEWWAELVGEGKLFDTSQFFVVCATMIGSCYGSTNPNKLGEKDSYLKGKAFPLITIRDIVRAQAKLCDYLGVETIQFCVGGSMGGQQVLEWSIFQPSRIQNAIIIAASAKQSSWAKAFNAAQKLALESDSTLWDNTSIAGHKGLCAARAIAMISYRSYQSFESRHVDTSSLTHGSRVESYLRYQGEKLFKRFTAASYWSLLRTMDSHDVTRNRGEVTSVLASIASSTLVIGIDTDVLFPTFEQQFLAENIPHCEYKEIQSAFGHDAFLIETEQLKQLIAPFIYSTSKHYCKE